MIVKRYPALRAALDKADGLAFRYRLWYVRDQTLMALEALDEYETGPENSREEVSPMGRSPQRDCKPAHDYPWSLEY